MTTIEWTKGDDGTDGKVWNPVVGCSRVSRGCERCYAERVAHRGMQDAHKGLTVLGAKGPRWTGDVRTLPARLGEPLRWRKPRRVFVNSMSDLFHESVPFEFVAAVFGVMAAAPQHTFQVLTKRPGRMREWFRWVDRNGDASEVIACQAARVLYPNPDQQAAHLSFEHHVSDVHWPIPNVWLGVSVEDQATADARIPLLLECPAAVRWVSYEPALGPIDFMKWLDPYTCSSCGFHGSISDCDETRCADCDEVAVYDDAIGSAKCPTCGKDDGTSDSVGFTCPGCGSVESWGRDYGHRFEGEAPLLDWIVVGGESGPGARPFDLTWARSTVEQCRDAGVKAFVKQLGALPHETHRLDDQVSEVRILDLRDRKGGDMAEWPEDLRVREWPEVSR